MFFSYGLIKRVRKQNRKIVAPTTLGCHRDSTSVMTNSMQIMTLHVMLLLKVNVIKKNSSGLWQMQNPQCVNLRFKVTSHKLFKRPMLEQCLLYNVIINVCVKLGFGSAILMVHLL